MGARQLRPANVWRAKNDLLKTNLLSTDKGAARPPWYDVLRSTPPSETLVRTVRPRHVVDSTSNKQYYKPQEIVYPEDALRRLFYKDHPWELARPRMIVELDGKDYQKTDWSKGLRQPGIPLSGESVVQRMLYRMDVEGMTQEKAYDVTRREFYRLRQEEEIARRVTLEEARHVGAYFGLDRRDIAMKLENNEFENWKVWAAKQAELRASSKDDMLEDNGMEDADDRGAPEVEVDAAVDTPAQLPQGA
ncbi:uncharacterized protein J7T54_005295 [Emericellopsis cladophorae]|uniref:Small ribosomal subunit protein mS23 n=1 Tax=Emericellopsis cladophorae TaxID=2686198 RepID=A0A9P9Y127_9HYPO|nr:uncharacterized protein J7T54_005295 [Emericellopsis cladophorae]KAI6781584.1 hypothetical protein J7T54_005295 [Emericellopsis cladophorae]